MAEADLHAKLDQVLAGQARQAEQSAAMQAVQVQTVEAIHGLVGSLATLREAVERLTEAASNEGESQDLSRTLKGILAELSNQTGHMVTIGAGLERLPALMEDTAINAVELAMGGGAGARPTP